MCAKPSRTQLVCHPEAGVLYPPRTYAVWQGRALEFAGTTSEYIGPSARMERGPQDDNTGE